MALTLLVRPVGLGDAEVVEAVAAAVRLRLEAVALDGDRGVLPHAEPPLPSGGKTTDQSIKRLN